MSASKAFKLGVLGANGKMGKAVQNSLLQGDFSNIQSNNDQLSECDVVLDFSVAGALLETVRKFPSDHLPAFVIGTTGWKSEELLELQKLLKNTPVFMSSNFSLGVLCLSQALEMITPILSAQGYQSTLREVHHTQKRDAPSGTALLLRGDRNDPIESVRTGNIIGEHEVLLWGAHDLLTFRHSAVDRTLFANGALVACQWVAELKDQKKPGWYSSKDFFDTLQRKAQKKTK